MVHSNSTKKLLRLGVICGSVLLVAAVAYCALTGSPYMNLVPWIPGFVGDWADRNPDFRNFPAFSLLSCTIVIAVVCVRGHLQGLWRTALVCAAGTAVFGTLLEFAQVILPNRAASCPDVIWSVLGAFAGGFTALLLLVLLREVRVAMLGSAPID
jgi:hypothetical protein